MSGRRRKGHAEEHHVDERWLVSYADMMTLLMVLFIVLFAISSLNTSKFEDFKKGLSDGFGAPVSVTSGGKGPLDETAVNPTAADALATEEKSPPGAVQRFVLNEV